MANAYSPLQIGSICEVIHYRVSVDRIKHSQGRRFSEEVKERLLHFMDKCPIQESSED